MVWGQLMPFQRICNYKLRFSANADIESHFMVIPLHND
jgi:hypothetical protein